MPLFQDLSDVFKLVLKVTVHFHSPNSRLNIPLLSLNSFSLRSNFDASEKSKNIFSKLEHNSQNTEKISTAGEMLGVARNLKTVLSLLSCSALIPYITDPSNHALARFTGVPVVLSVEPSKIGMLRPSAVCILTGQADFFVSRISSVINFA